MRVADPSEAIPSRPLNRREAGWPLTPAATGSLAAGIGLAVLGLFGRRPDVAVLALPLVGWVLYPVLTGRPWSPPDPTGRAVAVQGARRPVEPGRLTGILTVSSPLHGGAVHVRVGAPGHRPTEALLAGHPHEVSAEVYSVRTGSRLLFTTDYRVLAPDHVREGPVQHASPLPVLVYPALRRLGELPLPFRLQGLTGSHPSRRTGDGLELHDVSLFRPGDRLRRIDWVATARMSGRTAGGGPLRELYVRRTYATADATVMLVIDSRDEVGPDVETWGDVNAIRQTDPTSLDLAREAAGSIARAYLDGGDRVGLEDLGRMRRPVPPGAGRMQLQRLVERLAHAQPEGEPVQRRRAPRLPSGSLIVLLSTFLDDGPSDLAHTWRRTGHRVIAVDLLPTVGTRRLPSRLATAYRIVAMEREDRLAGLDAAGVEYVVWTPLRQAPGPDGVRRPVDDGTARLALTTLARARLPRGGGRR